MLSKSYHYTLNLTVNKINNNEITSYDEKMDHSVLRFFSPDLWAESLFFVYSFFLFTDFDFLLSLEPLF